MSMLAEPKRKQKFSINPRGTAWSKDNNKFGQKLLEKWGWKEGQGLGANKDGITEHVKLSFKNDSTGLGYEEIEGWTEHDTNFNKLLQNLSIPSPQNGKSLARKSLEEKSQKSKARVHYHKYVKGKDLTRYSDKDLASIFGKKSLDNQINAQALYTIPEQEEESQIEEEMPEITKSAQKRSLNPTTQEETSVKKKKKKDEGLSNVAFEEVDDLERNVSIEGVVHNFEVKRKKKKRYEEEGLSNVAFEEAAVDVEESLSVDVYEVKRKKKKKDKPKRECEEDNPYEVKRKKKLVYDEDSSTSNEDKKAKKKSGIENPFFHEDFDDPLEVSTQQTDNPFEVKRKKGKNKRASSEFAVDNPNFDSSTHSVEFEEEPDPDCDIPDTNIILNVSCEPDPPLEEKPIVPFRARLSFRSKKRTPEELAERNEILSINELVLNESMNQQKNNPFRAYENGAFSTKANYIQEHLEHFSQKLDSCQYGVENDLNESKCRKSKQKVTVDLPMVGEAALSDGEDKQVPEGTKLRFKNAGFKRAPPFFRKEMAESLAKKSYRHLIRGDIILKFKNTNLHTIQGYGNKKITR